MRLVYFDDEVRDAIASGTQKVLRAVGSTLGSKGRNVAIERPYHSPVITNDGVSIVREMQLTDPKENIAASVLRDVALNTNANAGDGTTTSVVIASHLILDGLEAVKEGKNPMELRREIEVATKIALDHLEKISTPVTDEDIKKIATISAESESIGKLVADAFISVGSDGTVLVERDTEGAKITAEKISGFEFDRGVVSPQMINDQSGQVTKLANVPVMVVNDNIDNITDVARIAGQVVASGGKNLVVIANNFSPDVLNIIIANRVSGKFNIFAIKSPGFGENKISEMQDITAVVGGVVYGKTTGNALETAQFADLGVAQVLTTTLHSTALVGQGAGVDARVETLRGQLAGKMSKYDGEKLRARIARLVGGVCIIRVGAPTDTEADYLKDKIDDAVQAVRSARVSGYTSGGGIAGVVLAKPLLDVGTTGAVILADALCMPFYKMAENAGIEGVEVDVGFLNDGMGFNFTTGQLVNMKEAGIIDSAASLREAITNATSAAAVLLTTSTMLIDKPTFKE